MRTRQFLFLLCLCCMLTACGAPLAARVMGESAAVATPPPAGSYEACPITEPPDPAFVPPAPYPTTAPYGNFWYGSNELWTSLQPDGLWEGLPLSAAGYSQKVFLWREGYDMRTEQTPRITMIGRRLDGDAPAYEHTGGTNGYHADMGEFMLTGISAPKTGCWEFTAQYGKESLTFVVWIGP